MRRFLTAGAPLVEILVHPLGLETLHPQPGERLRSGVLYIQTYYVDSACMNITQVRLLFIRTVASPRVASAVDLPSLPHRRLLLFPGVASNKQHQLKLP